MNIIYRVVWSAVRGAWVVTSELACRRARQGRGSRQRRAARIALPLLGLAVAGPVLAQSVTLGVYDPQLNDNKVGATVAAAGATVNLQGPQQFLAGDSGSRNTTLGQLNAIGRIVSGWQWVGAARLNPGTLNFGATVPDPITGSSRVVSTYATSNLTPSAPVDANTTVPDEVNVNGAQYIDARVGTVGTGGGTFNINIGTAGAASTASTNGWTMAAKQSSLFYADGSGGNASALHWQSSNRITFIGAVANPAQPETYQVTYVASYGGNFSVTTLDGATTARTVNNDSDLRTYNDWLIKQLQAGNLDPAQYSTEFAKAYSSSTQTISYNVSANSTTDEIAQPIGLRVAMHATGNNGTATVDAGGKLEVANSNGGAMRAEAGGSLTNNGMLAVTHTTGDGSAMFMTGSSSGTNNGVINGNFFLNPNGSTVDSAYGAYVVDLAASSAFTNNGILNLATGATNGAGQSAGIRLNGNSNASNTGIVNVGVTGNKSNGSMTGVLLADGTGQFTNTAGGNIYIGRGPQSDPNAAPADVAVNQGTLTAGITVNGNATALNQGTITIGSRTQNAAAIVVSNAPNATVTNSGTININGKASTVPRENDGILVTNSGAGGGGISNTGTINLNGVNGVGIKVLSTNASASTASSSGAINVAGGADPGSGTRNFGVWVEGQASGTATANVSGPVNLLGDGAIGIHARGRATVDVAAGAEPSFAGGTKQIAFFAYGGNARINVASTALDVTSQGSTLFRLENGAAFDGTGLSLTASGAGSQAVIGTGAPSVVNTNNAQIQVTGAGATGVVIEGGATGSIDAATSMHLSGVGAVAGIVDGQKHSLTGANSGAPVAATALTTAATLTESQSTLTGYIARNRAKLTNTGHITFTGAHATGIRVESGATATNSGNIAVQDGGTGIHVDGSGSSATAANTTGIIAANGGSVADRTRGVVADGPNAVVNLQNGSQLQLNGVGAIGAEAVNGGTINIASGSLATFSASDQIAYHAAGAGSKLIGAPGAVDASTVRSTIYRVDDGGSMNLGGAPALTVSGQDARGVVVSGSGATANLGSATIDVGGAGAAGVEINGGATGDLGNANVHITGNGGIGAIVDGQKTDIDGVAMGTPVATTLNNRNRIYGTGANAVGALVKNLGTLVTTEEISMAGPNSIGVWLQAGGILRSEGTTTTHPSLILVAHGTGVRVEGAQTQADLSSVEVNDGVAGVQLLNGAQLTLTGQHQNGQVIAHGSADGLLLDTGAASLDATGVGFSVDSGHGIENKAEIGTVSLHDVRVQAHDGVGIRTATNFDPASTVYISIGGSGTGYAFRNADGSVASGDMNLGAGYWVFVNGPGATGIQALTAGTVNTAATVNMIATDSGAALVAGTASSTLNTGKLVSNSTAAPVVDLSNGSGTSFTNSGIIQASSATAQAVRGSAGNDRIALTGGSVQGDIASGEGSDQFAWTAGTLNGSLSMGNGANNQALVKGVDLSGTYHLAAGSGTGNTLTLDGIQYRGGSFGADELDKGVNLGTGWSTINFTGTAFTLTDNLKLAHSAVNIDASSTLYAGNNVHPVISGGAPGSVVVTNAGAIDLTNGAGSPGNSVAIDGDYASPGSGRVDLLTTLNLGSALSNQFTDRLLVQGNASGATALNITPTAASTGELTDFNHNSAVDATEGISVVQVAGSATPDTFHLAGGYLAAGPWKYGLYAFAPGESAAGQRVVAGTGNQFWDYRLANVYVCETACEPAPTPPPAVTEAPDDGCVVNGIDTCAPGRPEVTPQVPVYISAPGALAAYGFRMLDNLHRRLGEVRHENALDDGLGGEAFARVIGGDYTYHTDVSFRRFGYDYDQHVRALQVGANIFNIDSEKSALRGGVAFTHGRTRLEPRAADGTSRTKFYSNSVAAFLTWQHVNGFYVDAVVSGDRHQGDVDVARMQDVARLRATGWTASVETGYPWRLDSGYVLEPQLQLSRLHERVDNLVDQDGTRVNFQDYDQNVGRLGLRFYRTWDRGEQRLATPYVRLNYIKGWGGRSRVTIGADSVPGLEQTFVGGAYGQGVELGLGGTYSLGKQWSFYGEADYQKEVGDAGARGWSANLGVRWNFQ